MFPKFGNGEGNENSPNEAGLNKRAASFFKMALNHAQQLTNSANASSNLNQTKDGHNELENRIIDELAKNDKLLHKKTPDPSNMTQPEDEPEPELDSQSVDEEKNSATPGSGSNSASTTTSGVSTRAPTPINIVSGIDISKLSPELRSKMKKFAKYEEKYPLLLDAYKTEKLKNSLLESFERLLQEHTPCSKISESGLLFQYLKDLQQKNTLLNDELKSQVSNLKTSQLETAKFQVMVKNLQQSNEKVLQENKKKIGELEGSVSQGEEKIKQLELDLKELKDNKIEDSKSESESESALKEKDEKIENLESQLKEKDHEIDELTSSSQEKDHKIDQLEVDLQKIQDKCETLEKSLKQSQSDFSLIKLLQKSQGLKDEQESEPELDQPLLPLSKSAKKKAKKKKSKLLQLQLLQQEDVETAHKETETVNQDAELMSKSAEAQDNSAAEIRTLKEKLKEADEEIEHLRDSLRDVGNELVELKSGGEQSEKTLHLQHTTLITQYEKQVKTLKGDINRLESTNKSLQEQYEQVKKQLSESETVGAQIKGLKDENSKLKEQIALTEKEIAKVTGEKENAFKEIVNLKKAKDEVIDIKLELNELKKIIELRNRTISENESRIKFLEEEKNTINEKNISLNVKLENLKTQIQSSNEQSNQMMTENENLKVEMKALNLKIGKLSNENSLLIKNRDEFKDKLMDLTKLKVNNNDQVNSLSKMNEELNMRLRELSLSFDTLQEELNDSRTMLQERTRETSTIRKILVDLEEEKQSLMKEYETKLAKRGDELESLKFEISRLGKKHKLELGELKLKLNECEAKVEKLSGTRNNQDETSSHVPEQQTGSTSLSHESLLTSRVKTLQDQLKITVEKSKELEKMNLILKKLNDDNNLKLEKLSKNYRSQQLELKRSRNASITSITGSIPTSPVAVESVGSPGSLSLLPLLPTTSNGSSSNSDEQEKISYIKNVLLGYIEKREQRSNLLPVVRMLLNLDQQEVEVLNSNLK